jgi:hypothetical protein
MVNSSSSSGSSNGSSVTGSSDNGSSMSPLAALTASQFRITCNDASPKVGETHTQESKITPCQMTVIFIVGKGSLNGHYQTGSGYICNDP